MYICTHTHGHAHVKSDGRRERENSYSGTRRGYLMTIIQMVTVMMVFVIITSPTPPGSVCS